jgi:NADH dehydrogenase FAD-containing subunit
LADYAFDVDTYDAAARLNAHLQSLPTRPESPGQYNVVVVGAGLTGIEAATEMPAKLRAPWRQHNRCALFVSFSLTIIRGWAPTSETAPAPS